MAELKDIKYWNRRTLQAESEAEISRRKLEALRTRSRNVVSKADKVATTAKELVKDYQKKSDEIELVNKQLENQIRRMREVMNNSGVSMSLFDEFLGRIADDDKSYNHIKRTLVRAAHPDKHTKAGPKMVKLYTELFRIVNSMFGGDS